MPSRPSVLFTAFEPSGDAHAAPVIAELQRIEPRLKIFAVGGPRMQEAGAELLATTVQQSKMGLAAAGSIGAVRKIRKMLKRWAADQDVRVHIPVDAPAANFPISKVMRKRKARIVHLVAPQIWAWGRWRIGKLRKLTSLVLCILPFEEQWFNDRHVPARFIGHPSLNRSLDEARLRAQIAELPQGSPRIAIFPGSRVQEAQANIRLLANAFIELQGRHTGAAGVIAAASPELAKLIRKRVKTFPTGLHMVTGKADGAIGWCDLALAVSGTITLDIALQRKPMIGVYKTGILSWLGAKIMLRTPFRLLPNIIADREIVPEFVPYIGGVMPIVKLGSKFLLDSRELARMSEELNRVCMRFANKRPAQEAANHILNIARGGAVK